MTLRLLAFDSALGPLSLALIEAKDDAVDIVAQAKLDDPQGAAEQLIPMIQAMLTSAGWTMADLDRIAVTQGPGRFTSIRIALAAARGLALAHGTPIVVASTLAVLAHAERPRAVVPVIPVGKGEVAAQVFVDGTAQGEIAYGPPETLRALLAQGAAIGPAAAMLDPAAMPGAGPNAVWLGRLALGLAPNASPMPLYARAPDAVPSRVWPIDTEDAEAIAHLHASVMSDAWSASAIRDLLASGARGLALGPRDQPWAMILYRLAANEAEILTFGVEGAKRRRGMASRLMESMLDEARRHNTRRIYLEVDEHNRPAQALYGRYGFGLIARRARYYKLDNGGFGDALVFARDFA